MGSTCTNIITDDPLLGPLGDYGGFTQTIPLQTGSSAIDTADDSVCPVTDQRAMPRPQGAHCDIGAFEYSSDLTAPLVITFTATTPTNSFDIPITTFIVMDDIGVTGYLITESAAVPAAGVAGWTVAPPVTYSVLSDGSYTLFPWAKDAAGHVSSVFISPPTVVVDTTAPDLQIDTHPADPDNNADPTFTFSSPDSTAAFECSLDSVVYVACSSLENYTGLASGLHTFVVRARDPVGNVDPNPAAYTWTIDLSFPETQIETQPDNPTNSDTAIFNFSSPNGMATFECSLEGAAFASCSSPKKYTGLAEGSHTFAVRAKVAAGKVDPTPASYTWVIDLTAPAVVSSLRANTDPALAISVDFTVAFSESVTGVSVTDFSLTTVGVSNASVTGVSGSGSVYTVQVNIDSSIGTLQLEIPVGASITDLAGNPLTGLLYNGGEMYTVPERFFLFLPLIQR